MSLRALLGIPQVGRTLASSLLARLPYTAVGLLLILRMRELDAPYAAGGAVAGAFAVGLAGVAPLAGRLVDRRGQRAVLVPCAGVCGLALLAIALAPDATPLGAFAALAALAGMSHPPVGGAMRALWPRLVPPDRRHAVFAIEAAGVELTFAVGPLLFAGGLATAASPAVALAACAGLLVAGTVAFASAPSSRDRRPSPGTRHTPAGALRSRALVRLLVAVACIGASFGAIEVAVAAHAEEHGRAGLVGPLLAAWALGSMVGGILTARSRAPADAHGRLVALLVATAAADGLVALAPSPVALVPALALAGCCVAPAFATLYTMVAGHAAAGTLTESYTWLTTGLTVGIATGVAAGGAVVDAASTHAAMGGAAVMVGLAALVVRAGARVLGAPAATGVPGPA